MLSQMNIPKWTLIVSSVILFVLLVGGCGSIAQQQIDKVTPTISVNSTALSGALTEVAQTMAAIPTSTPIPTNPLPASTPTQTPLPFAPLEGLRVAYIIDGNLYVQDSGKQAIQLTNSGQDRNPMFSDDGKKIAFYRGRASEKNQVYVINMDGTGERALLSPSLLATLKLGYDEFSEPASFVFVPGTHQLLFITNQLSTVNPKTGGRTQPPDDLLLVNSDTGEIKQLLARGQGGYFLASRDGSKVAIQTANHIDVITITGQMMRRNLVTYPAQYDYLWIPMSWTQDSSELVVVPPIPLSEIPDNKILPVLRTVWRYSLDGHDGVEIRLNPPPVGESLSISPDGNWIAYSYLLGYGATGSWDPGSGIAVGVYLGNLRNGTSQLLYTPKPENSGHLDVPDSYYGWSPDSERFIVHDGRDQLFMGSIHGELAPLGGGMLLSWIDNDHYLFYDGSVVGEVDRQERVRSVEMLPGINRLEPIATVFLER
jgi:Tol biopolymer transport system component